MRALGGGVCSCPLRAFMMRSAGKSKEAKKESSI